VSREKQVQNMDRFLSSLGSDVKESKQQGPVSLVGLTRSCRGAAEHAGCRLGAGAAYAEAYGDRRGKRTLPSPTGLRASSSNRSKAASTTAPSCDTPYRRPPAQTGEPWCSQGTRSRQCTAPVRASAQVTTPPSAHRNSRPSLTSGVVHSGPTE
jgi:hypothetical protein